MTIKELRTAAGMTQKAFGEYFGIPKRNIEDWENDRAECKKYLLDLMQYKLEHEGLIPIIREGLEVRPIKTGKSGYLMD